LIKKWFLLSSTVLSITTRKLETSSQSGEDVKEAMIESSENNNGGATRYFVNIGSRDNFDWMSLKDYLKKH
jgi:ATP-dependent RNA helicase DeaD